MRSQIAQLYTDAYPQSAEALPYMIAIGIFASIGALALLVIIGKNNKK